MQQNPNPNFMIELVYARMPFGKYEGRFLTDLPVYYLEWFSREGFPAGNLGQYLSTMFEIRTNGLEDLIKPLIRMRDASKCKR